ncbi:unnamed protein product [Anisakis simplex]|uniref:Helicase C-terminal domain-containing protein n=1 Tax=Anisakis simplex TaxID=6269 RepID=A0A3P6PEN9_ANISI|nr:unnamed protein product [Anisakis simplex]
MCPFAVKDAYLVYVVKNFHENRPTSSILIFSQTCRECQALAIMFTGLGFQQLSQPIAKMLSCACVMTGLHKLLLYFIMLQVGSLHSQISQHERMSALTRFRSGRIRILICTDLAARGLDIPHVS